MGWRNRPKYIDDWPSDIDYIMFIDENGDSNLDCIGKRIRKGETIGEEDKYFTVTGCIIKRTDFALIRDNILTLKHKHWSDGKFHYISKREDKIRRVCLHSSEIRGRKGPFNVNVINYEGFIHDLSSFMVSTPMKIISSTINKEKHWRKYANPDHPYKLCLDFVLERFARFFLGSDKKGLLILEARGKEPDREILLHIKNTLDSGTRILGPSYFKNIKGVYFNTKWCKKSDEQKSYLGLEIADLVSYPIHKFSRSNTKDLAFQSIENKVLEYPSYNGRGIKKFP